MKSFNCFLLAFLLAATSGGPLFAQCSLDLGPDQTLTCLAPSVQIQATMTGAAPFTISLPGAAPITTSQNPVVLPFQFSAAGSYCLTMTDATGCSATDCVNVSVDALAPSCDINASPWDCLTGTMTLFGASTSPGAFFQWTGPNAFVSTQQNVLVSTQGTYTLIVTTPNGCTSTCLANVTPGGPQINASVTSPACFGQNGGVITITSAGGTGPYTFQWTGPNGFTSTNSWGIGNLTAGLYTVIVTDATGCSSTQTFTVTQPAPFSVDILEFPIGCGEVHLLANYSGGTGPFTYTWNPNIAVPGTAPSLVKAFADGTYCVTVTDQNGCTASDCATINVPSDSCSKVYGFIRHDTTDNCLFDAGEPQLAGWLVSASGSAGTFYGLTDAAGRYEIYGYPGAYVVHATVPSAVWTLCQNDVAANLPAVGDSVAVDFLAQGPQPCPDLLVNITTNRLRRCFNNNFYQVYYQNTGTATAEDAVVSVLLDPFLSVVSATLPYTTGAGGELLFAVGDLDPNESGTFSIHVFVACNSTVLGQTHCTEATITSATNCPAIPEEQSLQLSHDCGASNLTFEIAATDQPQAFEYVVIEDAVMRTGGVDTVFPGQPILFPMPKNGSTWRLEATPTAPVGAGATKVFESVEGCGTNPAGGFSTGFVMLFQQNPVPANTDIDCTANTGSYDPNDKAARPEGFGAQHFIKEGTELEYLVRFQNTGTDTAFTVVVRDTLAAELDLATFRPAGASHPFSVQIGGAGVLIFTFDDILLVDSFTNEPLSNGFVAFSIKLKTGLALGSRVENRAAIFFDFNDPVITNTVFHTLGEDFVPTSLRFFEVPKGSITASPNPFSDATELFFEGFSIGDGGLMLQVFDAKGQLLRTEKVQSSRHVFAEKGLPSGLLFLLVRDEKGQPVGRGKLLKK